MVHQKREGALIVISGVWPDKKNGYGLAVKSALQIYRNHFKRIYFLGPAADAFAESEAYAGSAHFIPIRYDNSSKLRRFVKSLFSTNPAITEMYGKAKKDVLYVYEQIRSKEAGRGPITLVFEDTPAAILMPELQAIDPDAIMCLRSHNVLINGFLNLSKTGPQLRRLAWAYEGRKIRQFEKYVVTNLDIIWAISEFDAAEYRKHFGITVDGVFGVAFDKHDFVQVPEGKRNNILFLGSADLRKGMGLADFIRYAWPLIISREPSARFILAGKGTEQYHNPVHGIIGLGFVQNEDDFMGSGHIFINPQQVGSGIKIKSIVAMLSAKVLVTTNNGVEGVAGVNGEHYFKEESWQKMAERVLFLLANPQVMARTSELAREVSSSLYSTEHLSSQVEGLLGHLTHHHHVRKTN